MWRTFPLAPAPPSNARSSCGAPASPSRSSVEGAGSRLDATGSRFQHPLRSRGPASRSRPGASSMFDMIRAAPGISPTSPSSGTATTVSAFGSGTNENQFLFDGDQLHLPVQRRRASRARHRLHPGSADPVRGGVGRVRQHAGRGGQRHHPPGKRAVPVRRRLLPARRRPDESPGCACPTSAPTRCRAATVVPGTVTSPTSLGGPVVRERLWFFARLPVPA